MSSFVSEAGQFLTFDLETLTLHVTHHLPACTTHLWQFFFKIHKQMIDLLIRQKSKSSLMSKCDLDLWTTNLEFCMQHIISMCHALMVNYFKIPSKNKKVLNLTRRTQMDRQFKNYKNKKTKRLSVNQKLHKCNDPIL